MNKPNPYACYDKPIAKGHYVKDGMEEADTTEGRIACYKLKWIPFVMSTDCRYDKKAGDPRCGGCNRQRPR